MKKIVVMGLVILSLVVMVGCPADDNENKNGKGDNTPKFVAEQYRGTYRAEISGQGNYLQIVLTENKYTGSGGRVDSDGVYTITSPSVYEVENVFTVGDELWVIENGVESYMDIRFQSDGSLYEGSRKYTKI